MRALVFLRSVARSRHRAQAQLNLRIFQSPVWLLKQNGPLAETQAAIVHCNQRASSVEVAEDAVDHWPGFVRQTAPASPAGSVIVASLPLASAEAVPVGLVRPGPWRSFFFCVGRWSSKTKATNKREPEILSIEMDTNPSRYGSGLEPPHHTGTRGGLS